MRRRMAIIGLAGALLSPPAAAERATVPVVNHLNQTWAAAPGRPATSVTVRQAIERAAQSLNWTLEPQGDGTFLATLVVRSKHTVRVRIAWTATSFSVRYDSSIHMNYWQPSGREYIHPAYNDWTGQLVQAIRRELERSPAAG